MSKKEISLATVKEHNKPEDLWVIIEDKVYDVTKFQNEHPGGEDSLIEVAGRDGTREFLMAGHSSEAREIMVKYYLGDLAASDRKKKCPVSIPIHTSIHPSSMISFRMKTLAVLNSVNVF
ncbi:cytochrome b5 isoform X1 [Drosophila willistoni]|uniref:cytochrome b5 isoform X1 n=1 Tax=Drosophila willistoni TaxID=7260 RepID=UPI000C26CA4E|nr:cytochrome b5 isoform X1 [Drosophila willistoni]